MKKKTKVILTTILTFVVIGTSVAITKQDSDVSNKLNVMNSSYDYLVEPKEITEKIVDTGEYKGPIVKATLGYSDYAITVPIPTSKMYTDYNNVAYSRDVGSWLIFTEKTETKKNIIDKFIKDENNGVFKEVRLGRNKPVVLTYDVEYSDAMLYIVCSDSDSYTFYKNLDSSKINVERLEYSVTDTSEELAKRFDEDGYVCLDKYLGNGYYEIVSKQRANYESYLEYTESNGHEYSYRRVVGFPSVVLKADYMKLAELGYNPIGMYYDNYRGLYYIECENLIVAAYPLTNNSFIKYYIRV